MINYCDHHSGTLASSPTQLNPYKLGIELFRDIEDRWNRGAFGKEFDDCDDYVRRRDWNTDAGLGREKIFEVRKIHNDLTFIDEFLTLDFVREHKLFKFGYNESTEYYEIETREFPAREAAAAWPASPTAANRRSRSATATTRTAASCSWNTPTRASSCRSTTPATRWPICIGSGIGRCI